MWITLEWVLKRVATSHICSNAEYRVIICQCLRPVISCSTVVIFWNVFPWKHFVNVRFLIYFTFWFRISDARLKKTIEQIDSVENVVWVRLIIKWWLAIMQAVSPCAPINLIRLYRRVPNLKYMQTKFKQRATWVSECCLEFYILSTIESILLTGSNQYIVDAFLSFKMEHTWS